jgi:phospholipase/carboxylesterase
MTDPRDPHRGQPALQTGASPSEAKAAMIMLHGRGADAADIIGLSQIIGEDQLVYIAPEAAGHSWYPYSFLAPVADNEPGRTSALGVIAALIEGLGTSAGIGAERIALLGFSQGACLALEFAARNPRRYGAVLALSGGLIGDNVVGEDYSGSLDQTPVFVGCSDIDPHIPLDRVKQSAEIMAGLGADVTERIYPGMGHTIVEDEIVHVRRIVATMLADGS